MKIFIGEDEILIAEHISDIVELYGHEVVGMAHKKEEIISQVSTLMPDLVFLDIRMKGKLDGIEIAEFINKCLNIPFIFLTAHTDKAIIDKAIGTKPLAYLVKPFKKPEIYSVICLAEEKITQFEEENLTIKEGHSIIRINKNKIVFIKSEGNYVEIYTQESKNVVRSSIVTMVQELGADKFIRIHRSYLVNIKYVSVLNANSLLIEGIELPVSRKYQENIRKHFKNY